MASLGKVAVLYSDLPCNATKDDLDVVTQVEAVSATLGDLGFDVFSLAFSLDDGFPAALLQSNPCLVFNLVESVFSKGKWSYLAPALLEKLSMQYTGCSAASILLTTNKIAAKMMLKHLSIPTPPWVSVSHFDDFAADETYIIKAVYEDASIGLCSESVRPFRDIRALMSLLSSMKAESGREFFAEKFIDGREFSISIIGERGLPRILTPSEICFIGYDEINKAKILDYNAKWETASFEYQNTFSVPCFRREERALIAEMQAIAKRCWSFFELRGYARIDFRVDKEGKPWVLEINANPCITPGESGFLRSAKESGFNFADVIGRIIKEAGLVHPFPYGERCSVV